MNERCPVNSEIYLISLSSLASAVRREYRDLYPYLRERSREFTPKQMRRLIALTQKDGVPLQWEKVTYGVYKAWIAKKGEYVAYPSRPL